MESEYFKKIFIYRWWILLLNSLLFISITYSIFFKIFDFDKVLIISIPLGIFLSILFSFLLLRDTNIISVKEGKIRIISYSGVSEPDFDDISYGTLVRIRVPSLYLYSFKTYDGYFIMSLNDSYLLEKIISKKLSLKSSWKFLRLSKSNYYDSNSNTD